jgi:hypothetical protein
MPPVCSSAELFEMVWTVLNVFVSNMEEAELQAVQQDAAAASLPPRAASAGRSYTAPPVYSSPRVPAHSPEKRVHEFVMLVDTMASLYPDQPTSIVLRSVLQDYDVKRVLSFPPSLRPSFPPSPPPPLRLPDLPDLPAGGEAPLNEHEGKEVQGAQSCRQCRGG